MRKPFNPADIVTRTPLAIWRRYATIHAFAASGRILATRAAAQLYGDDEGEYILRAAVAPLSTSTGGAVLSTAVGAFLEDLRSASAAARLIAAGGRFSMTGHQNVALPGLGADFPEPGFVAEGAPIPLKMGSFNSADLGPPSKLAMITAHTDELNTYSEQNVETVVTTLLNDAASRALDKAVFSTAAKTSIRPAGILATAASITPAAGGGAVAMLADLKALVAAIVAAGGGAEVLIFANPVQILTINILAPSGIGYPLEPAPTLALGTVVAVDPRAFASGFGEIPDIQASAQATLHYEDTNPVAIGTAGSPNTVAAPVRSAFQQNMIALKMILRCAWTMRSGAVSYAQGVTW